MKARLILGVFIIVLLLITKCTYGQQFLLIGTDTRDPKEKGNADLIIVISVKNKEVKMASILRDTRVSITNKGLKKINAAYNVGGADLLLKTINTNFKTNIKQYAVMDFDNSVKTIDMLGGLRLDIQQSQISYINNYQKEQTLIKGIGSYKVIDKSGIQLLDGTQVLAYSRVRNDGDKNRVERQRVVLMEIMKLIRSKGISYDAAKAMYDLYDTTIPFNDVLRILFNIKHPQQKTFPTKYKLQTIKGSSFVITDISQTSVELKNFLK